MIFLKYFLKKSSFRYFIKESFKVFIKMIFKRNLAFEIGQGKNLVLGCTIALLMKTSLLLYCHLGSSWAD
jgi:hypothetical protein